MAVLWGLARIGFRKRAANEEVLGFQQKRGTAQHTELNSADTFGRSVDDFPWRILLCLREPTRTTNLDPAFADHFRDQ